MPFEGLQCPCRLKKEIEGTQEECPELPEPVTRVDLHQKLRDVKVKGAPGTKVESMKVVLPVYYCVTVIMFVDVMLFWLLFNQRLLQVV